MTPAMSESAAPVFGDAPLRIEDVVALSHPEGRILARSVDNLAAMAQTLPATRPFMSDRQTVHGTFRLITYEDRIEGGVHMAMVMGDLRREQPGAFVFLARRPPQFESLTLLCARLLILQAKEPLCGDPRDRT